MAKSEDTAGLRADAGASSCRWLRAFRLAPAFYARMAGSWPNRTWQNVPLAREASVVGCTDLRADPFAGVALAKAVAAIRHRRRTEDAGTLLAESLALLDRAVTQQPADGAAATALATAGIGVTVHGPDGRLLMASSVAAAVCPRAALGLDSGCEMVRANGSPLAAEALPVHEAITTRRPVRGTLIGVAQQRAPHVWVQVDAIPYVDAARGDLVVCIWSAACPNPSAPAPAKTYPRSGQASLLEIDGSSPEIEHLRQHMLRVAADPDVTVLVLGESGTGKERVANAIHRASRRSHAPFVVVNCAGLSPTLVEDEIFGHVRGAFTGAVDDQPGPFERANGGTVFLDEIGELTPELQIKLLRALQQRAVQRLGSRHETPFDVRVIAATHVDLARAKARGRFRDDLYYRLKVYELRVPPLRRRGAADIQALVDATLRRFAERKRRPMPALDPAVADLFSRYDWPGNVRELENTLERMMVAAGPDPWLRREHLPEGFGVIDRRQGLAAAGVPDDSARLAPSAAEILAAFEQNAFRHERAAAALGLSRHQFYRLLKRYDVRLPRARE